MKHQSIIRYLKLWFTGLFLVAGFFLSTPLPTLAAEKPTLFVSVQPQRFFVHQIAGDKFNIELMVQPGESPATYSPKPQQVAALASAKLYFSIGVPFESAWMPRIHATNPSLKVVELSKGLELRHFDSDHHDHGDHHHDDGIDPHVWTDPLMVQIFAQRIADELSQLTPEYATEFQNNAQRFTQALSDLHKSISAFFENKTNNRFLVFHPAWGYFAERYGLTQIAIEYEGKEPGAQALAHLIEQAGDSQVGAVFIQPQFSQRAARQVADALGTEVVVADPLAEDYLNNMKKVAKQIAEVGLY